MRPDTGLGLNMASETNSGNMEVIYSSSDTVYGWQDAMESMLTGYVDVFDI